MKVLQYISVFILGMVLLTSCSEEDKITYDVDDAVLPTLQAPTDADALIYTYADRESTVDFQWTSADPNISVEVSYEVQLALESDFSTYTVLTEVSDTETSVTIADINSALTTLEAETDTEIQVYCRVAGVIGDYAQDMNSAVSTFNVVVYPADVTYPEIYLPGAYQGWTPGDANGIVYSYNFDAVYENIVYIYEEGSTEETTQFKVSEDTDWAVNYGGTLTENEDGSYSSSLVSGGDNFVIPHGCYKVTVDLDALTILLEPTDHWGIIGSSVAPYDWSEDVDMFYNGASQQWELTTDLVAGELKFRANDAWTLNYGDTDADGSLDDGGDNIAIDADGTYDIVFDYDNMTYSVTLSEE